MFKEYWNGYLALGVIVGVSLALNIVGFLSVGYDWVGLEKATTNTKTYAEQQCSRQQASYALRGLPVLPSPQASSPEPQAQEGNPGEYAEPDWCDLAAQQSVADSTVGMEQAAWVALLLTTVGVVLVWRTLYYTRATLNEARGTTRAANDTVKVSERIGVAQVRAYLRIDRFISGYSKKDRCVIFHVNCENTGQSPASNVEAIASVEVTHSLEHSTTYTRNIFLPDITAHGKRGAGIGILPQHLSQDIWCRALLVRVEVAVFAYDVFKGEIEIYGEFRLTPDDLIKEVPIALEATDGGTPRWVITDRIKELRVHRQNELT